MDYIQFCHWLSTEDADNPEYNHILQYLSRAIYLCFFPCIPQSFQLNPSYRLFQIHNCGPTGKTAMETCAVWTAFTESLNVPKG